MLDLYSGFFPTDLNKTTCYKHVANMLMVSPTNSTKDKHNNKKKRHRFGTNVIVEQNVHQRVKNYTDNEGLEIQEYVSDRLQMILDKIEFNKKYFGPQFKIHTTLPDAVIVYDISKDKTFSVMIKHNKLFCKECESSTCTHVFFALATPDIGPLHKKLSYSKASF